MKPDDSLSTDVIVVGSGVAGLRAAIEAAEAGLSVALLAKDTARDSNTEKAQGGVAVALSDEDQIGLHYRDTLEAGAGLCDETAVGVMVGEGPRLIGELIDWGARFDRDGSRLAFTREGAHSARRVLHAHGDATGREILRALLSKAASLDTIDFHSHTFSIDLVVADDCVRGLTVLDEKSRHILLISAPSVLLATGGAGRIYRETTNPPVATGDGIAIAWRAGAALRDMEFVQFHPTALHVPGAPRFLLSEALRGEGGVLREAGGRRFMQDYDPRGELAPRDVVARAIVTEMQRSQADHVLLDMTALDAGWLRRRFPAIHATCLAHGIDLTRAPVPVAPAAHYFMGGVSTDTAGRTSVKGLYAAGETACTGVHGANRLASNSLLEGLVFGARAGRSVADDRTEHGRTEHGRIEHGDGPERESVAPGDLCAGSWRGGADAAAAARRIQSIAWERLGLVREGAGLEEAIQECDAILSGLVDGAPADPQGAPHPELRSRLEAINSAQLAGLVARFARAREESRGSHYRSDFPQRDDARFGTSSFLAPGDREVRIAGASRS